MRFSYDIDELAHHYRHYLDIMAYWDEILPGAVYAVDYEALIGDQEGQSRALLSACGLDWSDDVLRLYETARPVHTLSSAQVRQPIHARSVKLSDEYGSVLDPLARALGIID